MPWHSRRRRSSLAPPSFIEPCLPTVTERAPSGPGWLHEIKHDGYRLQIHLSGGRVRLFTRTGIDWTSRYPWIVEDAARLPVTHAVIVAEGCWAADDGRTDFNALHSRVNDHGVFAYALDLLMIDGADLRSEPLTERRKHLNRLLRKAKPGVRLSEHMEGDAAIIFDHACRLGLEGIVSKRADAPYRSGRARTWLKLKNKNAPAFLRVLEDNS